MGGDDCNKIIDGKTERKKKSSFKIEMVVIADVKYLGLFFSDKIVVAWADVWRIRRVVKIKITPSQS